MADDEIVQIGVERGVTVVSFTPVGLNLTESRMPAVVAAFSQLGDPPSPHVVIDLSNVEFFGSSFIEVLFRTWKWVQQAADGQFALAGVNRYCREILEVTNLTSIWTIYSTREQAVAALAKAE
jgi:anti-anti-sigma factor